MNALHCAKNLFENEDYAVVVRLHPCGLVEALPTGEAYSLSAMQSTTLGRTRAWTSWEQVKEEILLAETLTEFLSFIFREDEGAMPNAVAGFLEARAAKPAL